MLLCAKSVLGLYMSAFGIEITFVELLLSAKKGIALEPS